MVTPYLTLQFEVVYAGPWNIWFTVLLDDRERLFGRIVKTYYEYRYLGPESRHFDHLGNRLLELPERYSFELHFSEPGFQLSEAGRRRLASAIHKFRESQRCREPVSSTSTTSPAT